MKTWHLNFSIYPGKQALATMKKDEGISDTESMIFAPGTMKFEEHNSEVGKENDAGHAGPHMHAKKCELCVENRMCGFCICIYIRGAASQV